MTNVSILNKEKNFFNRKRLINKNKEEFKSELLQYARSNFPDKISDFSESSLGGMLLDFAAIVGESLTHYIDHQINELDYETATTEYSIMQHLRKANVTSGFSSPSSVYVSFYIIVPTLNDNRTINTDYLPVIRKETQLSSIDNISFVLSEDLDFTKNYKIIKEVLIGDSSYRMIKKDGICISGNIVNETFAFDEDNLDEFLTYTLSNEDITKILSVSDNSSDVNYYKEVEFLSQDTVYEKIDIDGSSFINIVPAAYRYVLERDFEDGLTTIRFGNSKNRINENGVLSNPEEISLPLLSRDYINNYSLDPKSLLGSKSLGVSPAGKVINIKYMYGGGTSHNIQARSINNISNLLFYFPNLENQLDSKADLVMSSLSVLNDQAAVGGTNPLSLEELKGQISLANKMQSRIVTHEDLLARIYSMPSNFGRISKISILDNSYSKAAKDLFIICKDEEGFYVSANDALKHNLSKYLNEYRIIGDTFNIIDSDIYNIGLYLKIKVSSNYDQKDVLTEVQSKIYTLMMFEKLQIGEPINVNKIVKIVLDTSGVLTITSNFKTIIRPKTNADLLRINAQEPDKEYNNNSFSVFENYKDGMVHPPRGSIFQLKYASDIEVVSG